MSTVRRSSWSSWWCDVVGLGMGVKGWWMRENLVKVIGDGKDTLFWEGVWPGESALCHKFPNFFHLSNVRSCSVASMGEWVQGVCVKMELEEGVV